MAPLKKIKEIDSLEDKCLKVILQTVISDLYLIHLMKQDLSSSLFLEQLRKQSNHDLLQQTSQRLQILPGLLNDQVREKLISIFYNSDGNDTEKFPSIRLDLLQVLLNDAIVKLDFGARKLPSHALYTIGSKCPNLKILKIMLEEIGSYPFDVQHTRLSLKYFWETKLSSNASSFPTDSPPRKKRKKLSSNKAINLPKEVNVKEMHFHHLREASILHGASNELLRELGQNAHNLKILKIAHSSAVTDLGVKKLCLRNPENHGQRGSCHLHELRVRSFHLSPCCRTLTELDIVGTAISCYGQAFMLKYLPNLQCLGDINGITDALEILVGNKLKLHYKTLPIIKAHPFRYKLRKLREVQMTTKKFMLLSSLCPDLEDLHISNPTREVDLTTSLESVMHLTNISGQIGQLKHLKSLSLCNIQISSVLDATRSVGKQLTYLRILCKNLNLVPVLEYCYNLVTFILDGSYTSTIESRKAFDLLKPIALKKLEIVKIKPALPTEYIYLILTNSKYLREVEINQLGEVNDDMMEPLINGGHFKFLKSFWVKKATALSIKTASSLVHKCPNLEGLKDLGGWNISCIQYCKLQNEIENGNLEISLYFGYHTRVSDSDEDSSAESEYGSNLIDALRNIFPVIIV